MRCILEKCFWSLILDRERYKNFHPIKKGELVVSSPFLAGPTRLELATSGVTGRRSDQLNYDPKKRSKFRLVQR